MAFLWFILGTALPISIGWCCLRHAEGTEPLLTQTERAFASTFLGVSYAMFSAFIVHALTGLPLNLLGYLLVQAFVLGITIGLLKYRGVPVMGNANVSSPDDSSPRWLKILTLLLSGWIACKLISGSVLLLMTPVYHDDVFNNWNMRSKIFSEASAVVLDIEVGTQTGTVTRHKVSSYPPTIPLFKAWLSKLHGTWNEPLANGIHIVWYVSILGLMYCSLRRLSSKTYALLGTYVLGSLPFFLIQGMSPYMDVNVAGHLFFTVLCMFSALREPKSSLQHRWCIVAGLGIASLVAVKNEGLVVYMPLLTLLLLSTIAWKLYRKEWSTKQGVHTAILCASTVACIALPWLLYKMTNNLTFGNTIKVEHLGFTWQTGVPLAMYLGLFMLGNWLLLPGIFLGCVLLQIRSVLRSPLLLPITFIVLVFSAQSVVYLFTINSNEVLRQTGFSRGLIHLVPLVVFCTMVLIKQWLDAHAERE